MPIRSTDSTHEVSCLHFRKNRSSQGLSEANLSRLEFRVFLPKVMKSALGRVRESIRGNIPRRGSEHLRRLQPQKNKRIHVRVVREIIILSFLNLITLYLQGLSKFRPIILYGNTTILTTKERKPSCFREFCAPHFLGKYLLTLEDLRGSSWGL